MIEIDRETVWLCRRCGCSGEQNFSWDGYCLVCEDDDGNDCIQLDEFANEEEHWI